MKRRALFVGVNNYQDDKINDLLCAVKDAETTCQYFRDKGFETFLMKDHEVSLVNVREKVKKLCEDLRKGDVFVFYFSGHGHEVGDNHFLLGYNASVDMLEFGGGDALPLASVRRFSEKCSGVHRLFILDCCRNSIVAGAKGGFAAPGGKGVELVAENKGDGILPPRILRSCQAGQCAFEDVTKGHGYFTLAMGETFEDPSVRSFSAFFDKLINNMESHVPPGDQRATLGEYDGSPFPLFADWEKEPEPSSPADWQKAYRLQLQVQKMKENIEASCGNLCEESKKYFDALKHSLRAGELALKNSDFSGACSFFKKAEKSAVWLQKNNIPFEKIDCCGIPLEMVAIKAGSFIMGSPENELGRSNDEVQHRVTLTKDYWLGKFQVTQAQYKAVMKCDPSRFKGDDRPVEQVSWHEAKLFCNKLNKIYSGILPAGYKFDLPTEAQWEYACRAGTTTSLNSGESLTDKEFSCNNLAEVAWYFYKGEAKETQPVGLKQPNNWGLYDMHGNVWEWCRDWYGNYLGSLQYLDMNIEMVLKRFQKKRSSNSFLNTVDPEGPDCGSGRVHRGGSWDYLAKRCRSASRCNSRPNARNCYLGFRLALVPVQ